MEDFMKLRKKILSLLVTLAMIAGLIPATVIMTTATGVETVLFDMQTHPQFPLIGRGAAVGGGSNTNDAPGGTNGTPGTPDSRNACAWLWFNVGGVSSTITGTQPNAVFTMDNTGAGTSIGLFFNLNQITPVPGRTYRFEVRGTHSAASGTVGFRQENPQASPNSVFAGSAISGNAFAISHTITGEALTALLATNANVKRIAAMVDSVCRTFGKDLGGRFSFPKPKDIADRSCLASNCRLGYREGRFVELAVKVADGIIVPDDMRKMNYKECSEALLEINGIGNKVADCVSLFGFGHLNAFPIDARIGRVLEERYGVSGNYKKMSAFAEERFGRYAGYAQELLYHSDIILGSHAQVGGSQPI